MIAAGDYAELKHPVTASVGGPTNIHNVTYAIPAGYKNDQVRLRLHTYQTVCLLLRCPKYFRGRGIPKSYYVHLGFLHVLW